ncbi:MAG: stage III sporulation protein AG [Oscillospiraceae bacterium]|nr:stage III sporulation protein AG [Oscillospiraceae bacterium]
MRLPSIPEPLKKYGALGLVILVGLVLLLWPKGGGEPPQTVMGTGPPEMFDLAAMERKMEQTLSAISGAGAVEVMLTLKTDMEVVVVQDTDTRSRREAEGGTVNSWDDELHAKTVLPGNAPIVQKRIYPQYQGALVVCDGAGDAKIHSAILDAVAALTGLRADCITVAKRAAGRR